MSHLIKKSGLFKISTFHLFYEGMWAISVKGNEPKDAYAANKGR